MKVLDAYGGAARWPNAERVEAVVSTRGLLLETAAGNVVDH